MFPHPAKYSCALHAPPSATYRLKKNISLKKDLRTIGRSHMNTYQGERTSQGKIIRIKRHFASLIFGILLYIFVLVLTKLNLQTENYMENFALF